MEKLPSNNNDIDERGKILHESKGASLYTYIPTLLTILIFSRKHTSFNHLALSISNAIRNPEIKRALASVSKYLNEDEQMPIHKIIGILEIIDTVKGLQNNSYRSQGIRATENAHQGGKHLGIINSLKEHANEDDKNLLDAIQSAVITVEKVQKVMKEAKAKANNVKGTSHLIKEGRI
ncbi:hypothetical protein [Alkaliphilus hydrothermalis]|uniref:Uncharacterized protein n=1 Tax=Alkaliphilus hydrothermalis TaxID=1482730 RepID=A0ABS2NQR9_9FIRM|nr:hypothetical protein [Alkaliphilus hydrothermalis]MBM7615186.1 hypothetical protein [Alkaliphilus hydrothermalis]